MNVSTIKMDRAAAQAKLDAYGKRIAKGASDRAKRQYQAAKDAYKRLAKGAILLDIEDVFNNCPYDDKGRPKLAIAAADARYVRFWWGQQGTAIFHADENGRKERCMVRVRTGRQPSVNNEGYSLTPMIPANVRPHRQGNEKNWHVLWEVERWAARNELIPERDPYLLKHVGGTLWAVLAEWDLTDLERAIMKQER